MITKTPGVCGGRACLGNSRMPVWVLVALWKRGATDRIILKEICPHLTQDQLDAARAYAKANSEEMTRDLQEQEGT